MKIKKIKNSNSKIIKLQALKLYSKTNKVKVQGYFSNIHTHLNKISNIIYNYNKKNKQILFIGFPSNFKNIFKNTKHKIIPEFQATNGLITNQKTFQKTTKIKKPDLIIIYNHSNKLTTMKESYAARIPTITFSDNLTFNNNTTYESLGNYEVFNKKAENINFLISLFKTITKKIN